MPTQAADRLIEGAATLGGHVDPNHGMKHDERNVILEPFGFQTRQQGLLSTSRSRNVSAIRSTAPPTW